VVEDNAEWGRSIGANTSSVPVLNRKKDITENVQLVATAETAEGVEISLLHSNHFPCAQIHFAFERGRPPVGSSSHRETRAFVGDGFMDCTSAGGIGSIVS